MDRPALPDPRTDAAWRYALVAGLLSGTYALVTGWGATGVDVQLEPVLFAAILGGVLFADREPSSNRVGLRTGLVASLPLLLGLVRMGWAIPGFSQPAWFDGLQAILLIVLGLLSIGFGALLGSFGGVFGEWIARKFGPDGPSAPSANG